MCGGCGRCIMEARETENTPAKERSKIQCIWVAFKKYIGPLIIFVGFSFAGAALFEYLESENEKEGIALVGEVRHAFLEDLWVTARSNNLSMENWTDYARAQLLEYENTRSSLLQPSFPLDGSMEDRLWTFWGALLFCITIYTTIGYGLIAPKTVEGRAACMVYALLGIPLCMMVLANFGKLMALALRKIHWLVWRMIHMANKAKNATAGQLGKMRDGVRDLAHRPIRSTSSHTSPEAGPDGSHGEEEHLAPKDTTDAHPHLDEEEEDDVDGDDEEEFSPSPIIPVLVLVLYILGGAVMYSYWEKWDYFESSYFVFISLTTIGLGDINPSHRKFFIASSIYLFFGLTLLSFVINTLMISIEAGIKRAQKAKAKAQQKLQALGRDTTSKLNPFSRSHHEGLHDKGSKQDTTDNSTPKSTEKKDPPDPVAV